MTINNDLEGLKQKLEEPMSPVVLCGKDCNGLNALHKAGFQTFRKIYFRVIRNTIRN